MLPKITRRVNGFRDTLEFLQLPLYMDVFAAFASSVVVDSLTYESNRNLWQVLNSHG